METVAERIAFGLTAPLPYVLITSIGKDGKPNVMGASWVTRVSFTPFLIMISISPERFSHGLIKEQKEFVVCYPSAGQEKEARVCGTRSGRDGDKFAASGLIAVPSQKVKPPTIKDCTVAFECRVIGSHVAGDHTLFIGEVVATTGNPTSEKHLFGTSKFKLIAMDGEGNR